MATSNNTANTNAVTKEAVAKLYVATFDRAPDAAGLKYWVEDSGLTINQIAESFFAQDETKEKYPDTLTDATFVETIYNNLFNRDADANGLVYWTNELESGNISRADMIMAIVNGAQGNDAKILDNKTEVGIYFADAGLNDYDKAVSIMENITADEGSVEDAKTQVDTWEDSSASFEMTDKADNIIGTDGDDTFLGKVADSGTTYQSIDTLDGKGGNDTLKLELNVTSDTTTGAPTVKNVESVLVNNNATDTDANTTTTVTVDLKNFDASLTDLTIKGAGSADVVWGTAAAKQGQKAILDNITLSGTYDDSDDATSDNNLTVVYDDSVVSGSTDASAITLTSEKSQTLVSLDTSGNGAIETYTVHTGNETQSQTLTINDASTSKVIVDGDAKLTLIDAVTDENGTAVGSITKLDASKANGDVKFTLVKAAAATLTGGAGNDTLDASASDTNADTVDGGAGNDTITTGNGADTIHGGNGDDDITAYAGDDATADSAANKVYGDSGNDTIKTGAGDDTVDGGGGNDTIEAGDGNNKVTGGLGNDKITTGAGADTIDAGEGDDTIIAGAGNNIVTGGKGADDITLGAGNDTLNYANSGDTGITTDTMDKVTGFVSGTDKIDFDSLAAASGTGVYNDTTGAYDTAPGSSDNFVDLTSNGTGSANFATFDLAKAAADDVFADTHYNFVYAYATDGTNTYLFVDSDQDGSADEAIKLADITSIDAGDIIA